MSGLIRQGLASYPLGWLSGLGMLLFLAVFIAVVFRVFRKKASDYQEMSELPLTEKKGDVR